MRALPTELRKQLEDAVLAGRHAAQAGVRAAFASLGVDESSKPPHLDEEQARLRRALRAKQRQLGGDLEVLVWDAAYEQWHRLLFARFLAQNGLLRHPEFDAPVTLAECDELAEELGEPDGWSVAARFAAEILPGIFRLDDPCVKLRLAPEHRAALERVVVGLPAEVFVADDSLGWVYQYWQSERKYQVNASEVKIGGADLGAVTQLFTENYMVRFLLENSLGAWWAARHPDSPLVKEFEFVRFDDDGQPAAGSFEGWPDTAAEVTVMDPCCGSGHFLVEAFGMLWQMRAEEEGLDPVAAQDAVLRDNLFGLELDPRCVQIAMFAVALAAWKQGGGYRQLPTPNIACSGIPAKAPLEEWTALANGDERLERALERLRTLFKDADTLGSLIDPRRAAEMANAAGSQRSLYDVDFDEVAPLLEKAAARETDDPATAVLGADAAGIARAAQLLSRTYTLIATNVPYLGMHKHRALLATYLNRFHSASNSDIGTAIMDRSMRWAISGAFVSPQTWTYLAWFESFRKKLLEEAPPALVVKLGAGAFRSVSGEVTQAVLTVGSHRPRRDSARISLLDLSSVRGVDHKQATLIGADLDVSNVGTQKTNPGSRLIEGASEGRLISDVADVYAGSKPGQTPRVVKQFWEFDAVPEGWHLIVSSPDGGVPYSGRNRAMMSSQLMDSLGITGYDTVGAEARGRAGVLMAKMGSLAVTLYEGAWYDDNTYAIIPKRPADLPILWAACKAPSFHDAVRRVSSKTAVPVGAVEATRIDWSQAAKAAGAIPEPWSDDPTQWLFEGRPEVSTEPLQVAVGRLVGYRWPEQADQDALDEFADDDGIVCLPPVGGELPAADRLTTLLAKAYGDQFSPALIRQLLEQAGSRKKTLGEWLRDDFFNHHCQVFGNRPFVWHITDGRKDGFSALVNYHRLNRAGLEKLTYTYLGDWIERQRAAAADDVAGADLRLAAAQELKGKLELILEGERPYDIYVRWKELHEQPIGWDPDLDDGVRLNIRPFVTAGVLRSKVNVHWGKDRGRNPDGSERHNDRHFSTVEKRQARDEAARS